TNVVQTLAQRGLQSAMAAPVHEHGEPLGSLVIATYQQGRRYSKAEQDALLAFAENVSIALTDAKTVSALREAQRVKEMFLAMASHELKTPLTAIMGTLRTFERHGHALNDEMRSAMLTAAIQRAEQLSHLINRLLIGARAELAKDEQVISLDELLDRSLQGFHDTTPVIVGEVPGLSVVSDARSVQGALGILLENAIAHSPDGSPVEVNSLVAGEEVRISVKNKGSLPDNADVENLFLPFQRGSEARSAGVGLGLYIASRLARSIGGFIDVKSVDDWVVFTLCFPLRSSSQIATGISG
ncbi:MAG: GAF domain-containing sensor histidine kinase, partial [Actinomycetota bacterium]